MVPFPNIRFDASTYPDKEFIQENAGGKLKFTIFEYIEKD